MLTELASMVTYNQKKTKKDAGFFCNRFFFFWYIDNNRILSRIISNAVSLQSLAIAVSLLVWFTASGTLDAPASASTSLWLDSTELCLGYVLVMPQRDESGLISGVVLTTGHSLK